MYDLVVDRDTRASGEAAVSSERRGGAALFNVASDFRVYLLCGDSRANKLARDLKCLCGNASGYFHKSDLLRIFDNEHILNFKSLCGSTRDFFNTSNTVNELQISFFGIEVFKRLGSIVVYLKS